MKATDEERKSDSDFLALSADDRWLYLHRSLKQIQTDTADVVQWAESLKGGFVVLGALATVGKWLLAIGAAWAGFKLVILR